MGCGLYFWVKSVFRFRLRSDCRRSEGCNRAHQGSACVGPGAVSEDPRTAGAGHPGASSRGHRGRQGTGRGVPPSECRWSKAGANALLAVKCRLQTGAGPTSSIGGLAALQPLDPKIRTTPHLQFLPKKPYCNWAKWRIIGYFTCSLIDLILNPLTRIRCRLPPFQHFFVNDFSVAHQSFDIQI